MRAFALRMAKATYYDAADTSRASVALSNRRGVDRRHWPTTLPYRPSGVMVALMDALGGRAGG